VSEIGQSGYDGVKVRFLGSFLVSSLFESFILVAFVGGGGAYFGLADMTWIQDPQTRTTLRHTPPCCV
jgi:hypothetical protein